MTQTEMTKIKVTLDALHFEYEGSQADLKSELLPLLKELDKLQIPRLAASMRAMQALAESAAALQTDASDELQAVKKDLDGLSELGEMESLRLQIAMDRLSKLMSTLSNILKKIDDTASAITANLK